MLFVNALAGGLLTLAAPILAIVLKSKIAGDIRVQAKEKVPAAVLNAAEAMKPHFDKVHRRLREAAVGVRVERRQHALQGHQRDPRSHDARAARARRRDRRPPRLDLRADRPGQGGGRALRQLREGIWATEDEPIGN